MNHPCPDEEGDVIHLRALLERADGAIVLAAPDAASARGALPALSGVHMSELPDPTPYLDGGELLLTTGMPFTTATASDAYFARLAVHGVDAVGFGVLGDEDRGRGSSGVAGDAAVDRTAASGSNGALRPVDVSDVSGVPGVPAHVIDAAARHGVLLLVVPEGRRFSEVSQAYWALVNESETASLVTSLGSQRALVRAALEAPWLPARDDARTVILRTLAQAVGGWTAYLPTDGEPPVIAPARMAPVLRALGAAVDRVNANGVVGAATFRLSGDQVTEHPVLVRGRVTGFLALGAGRRPTRATRELVLAAVDALATAERIRRAEEAVLRADAAAVASLLARGHADAAVSLATDRGVPVPARVRVLVVVRDGTTDAGGEGAGPAEPPRRALDRDLVGRPSAGAGSVTEAARGGRAGTGPSSLLTAGRAPHELVADLLRAAPLRTRSGSRLVRCDPASLVASLGPDAAVWFVPVATHAEPANGEPTTTGADRLVAPALDPVVLPSSWRASDGADPEEESGDDGEPRFRGAAARAAHPGEGLNAGAADARLGAAGSATAAPGERRAAATAAATSRSPLAPRVRAAASGALDWREAASAIARTADAARRAAPGGVALASAPLHDVDAWMRVLDAPEHADLRATALSFLGNHTSWERTARELDVHRNTVRQRIARVEALLGVDLQDADVTSRLWLALRAG